MIIRSYNPYIVVHKKALEDSRLSFGAAGLLAYLSTREDEYLGKVEDVAETHQTALDDVYEYMWELVEAGYVSPTENHGFLIKSEGEW